MVHDKLKKEIFQHQIDNGLNPNLTLPTTRSFFNKKDKFCWVPFEDIEKLKDIKKIKNADSL